MKRFGKARTARIKAQRKLSQADRAEVARFSQFLRDYKLSNAELVEKYGAEYFGLHEAELARFVKHERLTR